MSSHVTKFLEQFSKLVNSLMLNLCAFVLVKRLERVPQWCVSVAQPLLSWSVMQQLEKHPMGNKQLGLTTSKPVE